MNKKLFTILLCSSMISIAGCGNSKTTAPESTTETDTGKTITSTELLKASDYNIDDYVKLPEDYMSLSVELNGNYEATEEGTVSYINDILSSYSNYEKTTEKKVKDGSFINIDYEGKVDGKSFDGGTATGYELEIGSDTFIDGFEDQLIGKKVGETVTVNVTFPEDYTAEEVAGKAAVFTVKINSIDEKKTVTYDNLTDEFVEQNFSDTYNVKTKTDFYDTMKSEYENTLESNKESDTQDAVLTKLEETSEVTFPDGLLDKRVEDYINSVKDSATSAEVTYEEYLSTYYSMDEATFNEEVRSSVEASLKDELILEAIVKNEDVSINSKDFESFVDQYVTYYGYESNDAFYKAYGGEDALKLSYAESQALNMITEKANISFVASGAAEGGELNE